MRLRCRPPTTSKVPAAIKSPLNTARAETRVDYRHLRIVLAEGPPAQAVQAAMLWREDAIDDLKITADNECPPRRRPGPSLWRHTPVHRRREYPSPGSHCGPRSAPGGRAAGQREQERAQPRRQVEPASFVDYARVLDLRQN